MSTGTRETLYDLLVMETNPRYRSMGPWTQVGSWTGKGNKTTTNYGAQWMTKDLSMALMEAEFLAAKLPGKQVWVRGGGTGDSCPRFMWSHGEVVKSDDSEWWLIEQKNRAECEAGWRKMAESRSKALRTVLPAPVLVFQFDEEGTPA